MNDELFLAQLHACLDARRDPFDDPQLVAFLDVHPEHLAVLAALRADLHVLASAQRAVRPRRWPWVAAGAIAAITAVAVVAWPRERPREQPHGFSPRIIAASLEEIRPRAHVAANYCVREALLATSTTCFETLEYRSEPRW